MIFANHQLHSDVSNLIAQNSQLNTGNAYVNCYICCAKHPIFKEYQSYKLKPSAVDHNFPTLNEHIMIQHQLNGYILFYSTGLHYFDASLIY